MQDLCKTHLSSGVTSALCLSGINLKKKCLCCHSTALWNLTCFTTWSNEYLWRKLMFLVIHCVLFCLLTAQAKVHDWEAAAVCLYELTEWMYVWKTHLDTRSGEFCATCISICACCWWLSAPAVQSESLVQLLISVDIDLRRHCLVG